MRGAFLVAAALALAACKDDSAQKALEEEGARRARIGEALTPAISPWMGRTDVPEGLQDIPMITGKLALLDEDFPEWHLQLPDELRAERADQVGTVALLHCTRTAAGNYKDGVAAYSSSCDLQLVDPIAGVVVQKRSFAGAPPNLAKESTRVNMDTRPKDSVFAFLTMLPRK